ncbi:MAG: pyridoxamine 5'-phosphate oxidase family protein [Reichenbachiella sp.]
MKKFEMSKKNKVVRGANRAVYEKQDVFDILDDGFICHLSWVMNGEPFTIPTAYAREGETVYVHGSVKSRMVKAVKESIPVCLTVTHVDGMVLARSAFHHSVNYRSVVIFGEAIEVENRDAKNHALFLITESVLKGRWDECRKPNQKELDITSVLSIKINHASAKVRKGGPVDDKEDYELDHWAGELPMVQKFLPPISDEKLKEGIETSKAAIFAWENSN